MFQNLPAMLQQSAEEHPDHEAQTYWQGDHWGSRSYRELWSEVLRLARGFRTLGIGPSDRVALIARTRPEWVTVDFAVLSLGAVTVPIYPSLTAEQVAYMLDDSGARVVIIEDEGQRPKVTGGCIVVAMEVEKDLDLMTLDRVKAQGVGESWGFHAPSVERDALATLVYTSGTTGVPKGVMLSHGNILSQVESVSTLLQTHPEFAIGERDLALSFLPLSHILERMVHACLLSRGVTIAYARSTDRLAEDIAHLKPTLMVSVPRVLEKIYARVESQMAHAPRVTQWIFLWARSVGRAHYRARLVGQVPWSLALRIRMADRLVYRKLRKALGGRLKFVISGGAPLIPEIGQLFFGAGVTIMEGYGLTETSPVITLNSPELPRYGTVGPPLPGVEIRIADDGEVLTRGGHVMKGYWHHPEATAAALADGWFHTGDIGEISTEGLLSITDRKKNMIVLSTGKNVAPTSVEQKLLLSPWIEQALVLGSGRKYVTALLSLDPEQVERWAELQGLGMLSSYEILNRRELYETVMTEVQRVTEGLAPFERPKQVRFFPRLLSEASGELTPSLKIKQQVVETRYQDLVEDMYAWDSESAQMIHAGSDHRKGFVRVAGAVLVGGALGLLMRIWLG